MICIQASDIMHPRLSLHAKETVESIIKKLMCSYPALPVVDENGEVIGIVSEYDVFHAIQQGRTVHEFSAESIMSCGHAEHGVCDRPVTVFPSTRIEDIVDMIFATKFTILPVIDKKKLVGIISRKNVIYAMAERGFWPEIYFQKRTPQEGAYQG